MQLERRNRADWTENKTMRNAFKNTDAMIAKYLVVIVDRGMASEVNYFDSLEEAKRTFEEIARDYGYEPEEINGSDKYDVSLWEWTEDRYVKFQITEPK